MLSKYSPINRTIDLRAFLVVEKKPHTHLLSPSSVPGVVLHFGDSSSSPFPLEMRKVVRGDSPWAA